ncbi:MAG: hypothetical protein L0229_05175 [Blastocatellia bacterium]|nr:hypothetical protein [Blastocatellia bacterium]
MKSSNACSKALTAEIVLGVRSFLGCSLTCFLETFLDMAAACLVGFLETLFLEIGFFGATFLLAFLLALPTDFFAEAADFLGLAGAAFLDLGVAVIVPGRSGFLAAFFPFVARVF